MLFQIERMLLSIPTNEKNILIIGAGGNAYEIICSLVANENTDVTLVSPKALLCENLLQIVGSGDFGWFNRNFKKRDLEGKQIVFNFDSEFKLPSSLIKSYGIKFYDFSKSFALESVVSAQSKGLEIGVSVGESNRAFEERVADYIQSRLPEYMLDAAANLARLEEQLGQDTIEKQKFLSFVGQKWDFKSLSQLTKNKIKDLISLFQKGDLTPSPESILQGCSLLNDCDMASQSTAAESGDDAIFLTSSRSSSVNLTLDEVKGFVVKNASQVVSEIAYSESEILYVYPAFPENYAGQQLYFLITNGRIEKYAGQKLYGGSAKVINTQHQSGKGGAILGSLKSGSRTSAFMSSAALGYMLPAMYNIVRDKLFPVFHVSAQKIDEHLIVTPSLQDIYKVSSTGFSILSSSDCQEAHDMALVAHIASELAKIPIIHCFDGSRVVGESSSVNLLTPIEIKRIKQSVNEGDPLQVLCGLLQAFPGKDYKPFEYFGNANAKLVIVSMGCVKNSIRAAVKKLNDSGIPVGFLSVRVFRPWSRNSLLSNIPESVDTIIIIDEISGGLALDVETSFYGSNRNPSCSSVSFEHGIENIHPVAILSYIKSFLRGEELDRISLPVTISPEMVLLFKTSKNAIFWDKLETKKTYCLDNISKDLHGNHLQRYSQYLATSANPSIVSHLQFSPVEFQQESIVLQADLVMCNDLSIVSAYNFINLLPEGKLFINTALCKDELFANLHPHVLKELHEKKISVFALDATLISQNYTLFYGKADQCLSEILAAVFYRLAFDDLQAEKYLKLQKLRVNQIECRNIRHIQQEAVLFALENISSFGTPKFGGEQFDLLPSFVKGTVPPKSIFEAHDESEELSSKLVGPDAALLPIIFPDQYKLRKKLRPDIEGAYSVKVTENYRLTPVSYDRNVFHLELDITDTGLKYEIGDALGVYAQNDVNQVREFLNEYGINADQYVYVDRATDVGIVSELRSVEQIFIQTLDIFGKPGKKFYEFLAFKASEESDKDRIAQILETPEGFEKYVEDFTPTFADLLLQFRSAKLDINEVLKAIPAMKPRHYSIASSQRMHPNSVHLLVVVVDWVSKDGVKRTGQATRFLVNAKIGSTFTVSVKPSVMKLPKSLQAPVIMAGLGTGMAPFRAFIEERMYWKQQGKDVGPMILYFGSRNRANEYLYGEELEAYHEEGILTYLRLAFSRDQKEKIYIQHKIQQDQDIIHKLMIEQKGSFYLCGPTWPVPDVTAALLSSFSKTMSEMEGLNYIEDLKHEERFVLEVY